MSSRHVPRVRPGSSTANPKAVLQRTCSCGGKGGSCEECKKKREDTLQRSAVDSLPVEDVPPLVYDVLRDPGETLESAARLDLEDRIGHDFSHVRVHTDARAAQSARMVNALAYTVGRDVVFDAGQYRPDSFQGRRLLAHELTHVAQQPHVTQPPANLRVGERHSGAEHEAEHVADGVRSDAVAPSVAPSLQRQPREPDTTAPSNVGPPVSEVPRPPIFSLKRKDGKWFWRLDNIPGLGSTGDIPADPRDIPKTVQDLFKKKPEGGTDDGEQTFPMPGSPNSPFPTDWVATICKREPKNPICLGPLPSKPPATPGVPLIKPIGVFWTTTVQFEYNQPFTKSPDGGLTPEGQASINTIVFFLNSDPTLQVRLIGHASSEGKPDANMELSKRRARLVVKKLKDAGLWVRVVDPIQSDGKADGCSKVEFGVWACGESKATQEEVRPEERKVEVTFLRNPPPKQGPLQLTPPSLMGGEKTE
jgi:Domain of unknown function (DUF4157)/OmpA family